MTHVYFPGQDGFDQERGGFQTAFRHEPSMIVAATTADDVLAAVRTGLPVVAQATGHGTTATAAGGVLVNTSRMTGVRVDPATRTAHVEAGARGEHVVDAAAPHGLAPLTGSAPHVGVVGYTLGGGIGLLAREFGYAADHVLSIDLVTPGGEFRHVTADSDPDLFWALRGGRDGFGVVTAMEIGLVAVPRVYGGGLMFDVEHAGAVLGAYREWTATLPETVTTSVGMIVGQVVHVRIAATEDVDHLLAPLRELGPRTDQVGWLPFTEAGSIYRDPDTAHGYYGDNVLLSDLPARALDTVRELAGSYILDLRHLGGALSRPPEVPNAVPYRSARFILRVLSPVEGADLAQVRAGHQRIFDVVAPWTIGRALNFVYGPHEGGPEVHDAATARRLAEIRNR